MPKIHTAFIAVGSNLGNKIENCKSGIRALTGVDLRVKARSRIYETEPVDFKDQDWFVNFVVKIETMLDPLGLLERIQSVQRDAGRISDAIRFGPRVLDLDIIFFDDIVLDLPQLVIPHPRMHKRRFVLRPLCDIDPGIMHPLKNQNVQTLLDDLDEKEQRIREYK